MQSILNWLDHRTGYKNLVQGTLYEPIPGGARWRYVWGSTLVFVFTVQLITGVCLWMSYAPSATTAWESVFYIQNVMTLGWLVRGLHHFAAQAMVVLLVLHLMQVVIDGAYRAPREVNFWLGLILMQIVLFLGLTGYLLPWDQKGYYATQVATNIMGSAPVVGPYLQTLIQGGEQYGNQTLTRFFALHAGILPATLIGFLALHIYVFRRHGIHAVKTEGRPDGQFWPDQVLRDAVACLGVLAAILGATLYFHGAELMAPANPAESYAAARPEWYYLFLFKFLKFGWVSRVGEHTGLGEAFGAIVVPGVLMGVLTLAPIIAYLRRGHRFNVAYLWVVVGIAGTLTSVAYYDDWYSSSDSGKSFREAVRLAHRDAERVTDLALSPTGIPPQGAAQLLQNDPLTRGPGIFNQYCASCHQPADPVATFTEKPVAPPLTKGDDREHVLFGSRDWIRSVLTNFAEHFAPLENTQGERAEAAQAILNGSMRDWSDTHRKTLLDPVNAADFTALVEFLYAQSRRPDAKAPDDAVVLRGKEIFKSGEMKQGSVGACVDCHSMRALTVVDQKVVLEEESLSEDLFPVLTGYGSTEWLTEFISDPQKHYAGDSGQNAMPAFGSQLSEQQLQMVARWLAQDYYLPSLPSAP
ncbi:cytochrome b N-terminal domain-containing protein [Planctomicrobium sp. SH664]|uniref:cytochrome b N-terminal domain-containing protein n=1 Tax=Planctomicrobium sp. SH664 TaxID=3448125 RepID=UPI003F5C2919